MNDTVYINLVSIVAEKIKNASVLYEFCNKLRDILNSDKTETFYVYVTVDGIAIDYVLYNNIDSNTDVYMVWGDTRRRWLPTVGITTEQILNGNPRYTHFGKLCFNRKSALSVGNVIFQTRRDDSGVIGRIVITKGNLDHFKTSWNRSFNDLWFLTEADAIQKCRELHNYWSGMYY